MLAEHLRFAPTSRVPGRRHLETIMETFARLIPVTARYDPSISNPCVSIGDRPLLSVTKYLDEDCRAQESVHRKEFF